MCGARAPEASPCCFRIGSAGGGADLPVCVVVSVAVGLPGPGAAASPAGCTVLTAYRFVRSDWNLVCKTTLFKTWSRAEYVCRSPYVGCAS